jgi:hypothetical protein
MAAFVTTRISKPEPVHQPPMFLASVVVLMWAVYGLRGDWLRAMPWPNAQPRRGARPSLRALSDVNPQCALAGRERAGWLEIR